MTEKTTDRSNLKFLKSLGPFPSEKKALIFVLVVFALLDVYRAVHLYVTGFIVSDEYGYIQSALSGQVSSYFLYDRYFFGVINDLFFRAFGINTIDKFIVMLPFYLFLWSLITEVSFYKIMKLLSFSSRVIVYSLLSSLFLISFVLLSLGFLTEPVGLAMAMLGIYFALKPIKENRFLMILLYSFLSGLFFSAAMYSRQPYAAFLIGGTIVPPLLIMLAPPNPHKPTKIIKAFVVFFMMLTLALSMLSYSGSLQAQITDLSKGIGSTIANPVIETSSTSVATSNMFTSTTSTRLSSSTSGTSTTINNISRVALNPTLRNTLYIFFGGIFLGWGPILLFIGSAGFFSVFYMLFKRKSLVLVAIILLCVYAFGSYFVVSYLFSPDQSYLTVQHYSTIIRFSDTATPAFFLSVPFFFSLISKKKVYSRIVLTVLLVTTLSLLPVYQVYAASNLDLSSNPFVLSYRSPGVDIRDYILAHPNETFQIIGFTPVSWWFVPDTGHIKNAHFYPYLNYSSFTELKLANFYVYGRNLNDIYSNVPYLNSSAIQPFSVVDRTVVLSGPDFILVNFELEWK